MRHIKFTLHNDQEFIVEEDATNAFVLRRGGGEELVHVHTTDDGSLEISLPDDKEKENDV